jgi:hypothetical protein
MAGPEDAVRVVRTLDDGESRDVRSWTLFRVRFRHLHRAPADLRMRAAKPAENLNANRTDARTADLRLPRTVATIGSDALRSGRYGRSPANARSCRWAGIEEAARICGWLLAKAAEHAVFTGSPRKVFPVHVRDIQVVVDTPQL